MTFHSTQALVQRRCSLDASLQRIHKASGNSKLLIWRSLKGLVLEQIEVFAELFPLNFPKSANGTLFPLTGPRGSGRMSKWPWEKNCHSGMGWTEEWA